LAKLIFDHEVRTTESGTVIEHSIAISGVSTPLFSRLIGKKIAKELPAVMENLRKKAESVA